MTCRHPNCLKEEKPGQSGYCPEHFREKMENERKEWAQQEAIDEFVSREMERRNL